MLFELAERVGPSLPWWFDQPMAYALWAFEQLADVDRRRRWTERVDRLEAAELMMLAVNEPGRLVDERRRILSAAAGTTSPDALETMKERWERTARFVRKGRVLDS